MTYVESSKLGQFGFYSRLSDNELATVSTPLAATEFDQLDLGDARLTGE
jgi:hypothetical protein